MEQREKLSFREIIRNRPFATLVIAQVTSNFGDWLSILALFSLIAFHTQGSATAVSGVVIALTIPIAVVGPLAGVLVDRWDLKRTMVTSDIIRAMLVMLLPFTQNLFGIYLLIFALSLVSVFFSPAQTSALALIVKKEQLLVANALITQMTQLNRIISPAIAGALVGWYGERICFYIDSLTFIGSAILLSTIALRRELPECRMGIKSIIEDLISGVKFVLSHQRIRFVIVFMTVAILASAAVDALSPIYIRDLLKGGARLLGLLMSCVAAGTIIGAVLIARYGHSFDKVPLLLVGTLGIGIGVLLLATTTRDILAMVVGFALGLVVAFVTVPSQTLIQQETPQSLLGRVASLLNLALTSSQLVSLVMAGLITDRTGVRSFYYGAGLMLMLVTIVGHSYYMKIKRLTQAR